MGNWPWKVCHMIGLGVWIKKVKYNFPPRSTVFELWPFENDKSAKIAHFGPFFTKLAKNDIFSCFKKYWWTLDGQDISNIVGK